jgi:capsular exopolysaccharide synthesis family protein
MKRYGWIVLACMLIAAIAGVAMLKVQKQVFQASSTMYVVTDTPSNGFNTTLATNDSIALANNYATEIMSRSVMEYIYSTDPQLKLRGYAPDDLLADVVTVPSATTSTFLITASALNSSDAALMADDVASGFQSYVQTQSQQQLTTERTNLQNQQNAALKQKAFYEGQLEALPSNTDPHYAVDNAELNDVIHTLDTLGQQLLALPTTATSNVVVIQLATARDATVAIKTNLILALSVGLGLLVGLLILFLVIYVKNPIWSEEQVSEQLGMTYLGSLSSSGKLAGKPALAEGQPLAELTDICANLHLTGTVPGPWRAPRGAIVLVTSPRDVEGKTTVAIALAAIMARGGCNTLLVDGNLGRPATHLPLGASPGAGLSDVLRSGSGLEQVVQRTAVPNLWLLAGGAPVQAPALLLEQKMPGLLEQSRKSADIVVLDGPSLLGGAEASVLASMADGVALVVDARHDRLTLVKRAKEVLASLTHVPVGLVLNRFSHKRGNHYYAFVPPDRAGAEEWKPVPAPAPGGSGNGSGNGHAAESQSLIQATVHRAPLQASVASAVKPAKTSLFDYTPIPPSQPGSGPWNRQVGR